MFFCGRSHTVYVHFAKIRNFVLFFLLGSISSNELGSMYPYRASKTALNMITKSLSNDLKDNGIIVVSLHPRNVIGADESGLLPYSDTVPNIVKFISMLNMSNTGGLYSYNGILIPF